MTIESRLNQIKKDNQYDFSGMLKVDLMQDDLLRIYRDNELQYISTLDKIELIPEELLSKYIVNENICKLEPNAFKSPFAINLYIGEPKEIVEPPISAKTTLV